ncbi:hypothetical protein MMC10_008557 [Thelotrema lepadinum]|nr:hypothetical protein [Thelotrema lepadinum]
MSRSTLATISSLVVILSLTTLQFVQGEGAQLSQQISIAFELATNIRAGHYTASLGIPDKIALMGHSFGSAISHGVAAIAPQVADAIILTGYGLNFSVINFQVIEEAWNFRIASGLNLAEPNATQLDAGYVSWVDLYANINTFFKAPYYDLATVEYVESHKTGFAIVEALTTEVGPLQFPFPKFTGPVLLITGEYDFLFCDGYCVDVLQEPAAQVFGASRAFKAYIQPGTGHVMNFHHNATGYYQVVTNFLEVNGL